MSQNNKDTIFSFIFALINLQFLFDISLKVTQDTQKGKRAIICIVGLHDP